jgi:hypothetical protein
MFVVVGWDNWDWLKPLERCCFWVVHTLKRSTTEQRFIVGGGAVAVLAMFVVWYSAKR